MILKFILISCLIFHSLIAGSMFNNTHNLESYGYVANPVLYPIVYPVIFFNLRAEEKACYEFQETGTCRYGDNCKFSHYVDEMLTNQTAVSKIKTKYCGNLKKYGRCAYGQDCIFAHNESELQPKYESRKLKIKPNSLFDTKLSHRIDPTKYKASLCKYYETDRGCSLGDSCNYAHGEKELRFGYCENYKTKLCEMYKANGKCDYGEMCMFAHGERELRLIKYKTYLCKNYETARGCDSGDSCEFAHGEKELRPKVEFEKYKTKLCKSFEENGDCELRGLCQFAHGKNELRYMGCYENYKTELCKMHKAAGK